MYRISCISKVKRNTAESYIAARDDVDEDLDEPQLLDEERALHIRPYPAYPELQPGGQRQETEFHGLKDVPYRDFCLLTAPVAARRVPRTRRESAAMESFHLNRLNTRASASVRHENVLAVICL